MTDQRAIDLSVDVDGTAEEVWEAIATGPGVSSWFIPTRIEGRPGGEVAMDQLGAILDVERQAPCQHLVEGDTQCV